MFTLKLQANCIILLQNELLKKNQMKRNAFNSFTRNLFVCVLTLMFLMAFNSCATKAKFATSTVVPAARGDVKVTKNNNNNYNIKIEIANLAEVERMEPPRQTYVVWMVSEKDETRNLGQIVSKAGTFSDNLKASFETATSFKPTKIFITAEDNITTEFPGGQVILSTNRF